MGSGFALKHGGRGAKDHPVATVDGGSNGTPNDIKRGLSVS